MVILPCCRSGRLQCHRNRLEFAPMRSAPSGLRAHRVVATLKVTVFALPRRPDRPCRFRCGKRRAPSFKGASSAVTARQADLQPMRASVRARLPPDHKVCLGCASYGSSTPQIRIATVQARARTVAQALSELPRFIASNACLKPASARIRRNRRFLGPLPLLRIEAHHVLHAVKGPAPQSASSFIRAPSRFNRASSIPSV